MNIFSILLLILVSINTFAEESPFTSTASLVSMSMGYTEYDSSGNILDSEDSSYIELGGVEVSLGYTINKDVSSSAEITFSLMILMGETTYTGSYIDSEVGYGSVVSTTLNTIWDKDISYKQSRVFNDEFEINYGIGLGHRYWERGLSTSQVEVYSWYSIRPMFGINTINKENFNLGMFIEYQYGFDTKMKSSNPKLEFELGGADILEVSFPVSYKYESIDLFFEAVLQKQMIKKSNLNSGYYEPQSTAYNSYLKLGLECRF